MSKSEKQRYLAYDGFRKGYYPGLGHVVATTQILLHEALLLDRVAVLPPLEMNALHNRGIKGATNWGRLFDFSALTSKGVCYCFDKPFGVRPHMVDGNTPHEMLRNVEAEYVVRKFPDAAMFGEWMPASFLDVEKGRYRQDQNVFPSLFDLPSKEVLSVAEPIVARIRPFSALHVRRNDVADERTSGAAICAYLEDAGISPGSRVFICSDERDPSHFTEVAAKYDVILESEISELNDLWEETQDNYFIYMVVRTICSSAEHNAGELRYLDVPQPEPSFWQKIRFAFGCLFARRFKV